MDGFDKQWARKYILDPLTAPEPSQETGLGTSHYNPLRAVFDARIASLVRAPAQSPSPSRSLPRRTSQKHSQSGSRSDKKDKGEKDKKLRGRTATTSAQDRPRGSSSPRTNSSYPTPPSSASPTRQFHPSIPLPLSYKSFRDSSTTEILTPPLSPAYSRTTQPGHRPSPSTNSPVADRDPESEPARPRSHGTAPTPGTPGRGCHRSLLERFPGDMSHRSLDVIKRDARAAERPHRHRKRISDTDVIDSLDTIGGTYHHGGPYDATLLSRNLNKMYSPVAAVHDSNMEALRATPKEYVIDSLERHMPLQGTASIPPGNCDMSGNRMDYEEGTDLMRDPNASGGPYRRYADVKYHPSDLKGKGEPSYTLEKDAKAKSCGEPVEFEMQSGIRGRRSRPMPPDHQRSFSNAAPGTLSSGNAYNDTQNDLQRRNSTGNKLGEGLKRRFGSLRRKKAAPTNEAY